MKTHGLAGFYAGRRGTRRNNFSAAQWSLGPSYCRSFQAMLVMCPSIFKSYTALTLSDGYFFQENKVKRIRMESD
jgi:hypothetical protein